MTILEGITNLKGRGIEIPDCSRDDLPEFFKQQGYTVGAEVGVAEGENSELYVKAGLKLYSVDPWNDHIDYSRQSFKGRLDKEFETATKRLAPYGDLSVIVRKTSMDAVKDFAYESLDFVYIDGHHGYKYVTEDIYEWSKRVRSGGAIAGHDYLYTKSAPSSPYACHVRYVVDSYTKAMGIENWYILGRKNADPGEKRDRCRSWMWIKE